jgi:sulfatase-like protein
MDRSMYRALVDGIPRAGTFKQALILWWGLFLVIQQAERVFLIQQAWALETPTGGLFLKTLWTGLRADLISATFAVLIAVVVGLVLGTGLRVFSKTRGRQDTFRSCFQTGYLAASWCMAAVILSCLTIDVGYYRFNKQHLDFVFFEYVGDLVAQTSEIGLDSAQAAQQTTAELRDGAKWVPYIAGFFLCELAAIAIWWWLAPRLLSTLCNLQTTTTPAFANTLLVVGFVSGLMGFHRKGPEAIRTADISSGTYYTLAQNPIIYALEGLRATIDAQWKEEARLQQGRGLDNDWESLPQLPGKIRPSESAALGPLRIDEALSVARQIVARGETFPFPKFPLVRTQTADHGVRLERPANVLLIFVEALDRRYLGQVVEGIRVTPFMDKLKDDSIFVENFFANGAQTARGLFATFCSYYPRRGLSAMKTRYTHDYLCLPDVLKGAGYHTEMVISSQRDIDRLHVFFSRNGMQHILDETDFPPGVARVGSASSIGRPDGPLFDLLRSRIVELQGSRQPFLLATKTLTTHHPFHVPSGHAEVEALRAVPDGYVPALRYLDLELERFFTNLRSEGLLRNTMVLILGDHGRHEHVGNTAIEKQVGHFLTPLFIWMDDSLRKLGTYRPRTVSAVASQIDVTPTILAMNGLMPRVAPFLGRDISCLLMEDCVADNFAYLISPYGDEVVGLADQKGILLYGLRTKALTHISLGLTPTDLAVSEISDQIDVRYRELQSLYLTSNWVLDRNLIWSWKELGGQR